MDVPGFDKVITSRSITGYVLYRAIKDGRVEFTTALLDDGNSDERFMRQLHNAYASPIGPRLSPEMRRRIRYDRQARKALDDQRMEALKHDQPDDAILDAIVDSYGDNACENADLQRVIPRWLERLIDPPMGTRVMPVPEVAEYEL